MNFSTDFEEIKKNGPYDVILINDVLDHTEENILIKAKEVKAKESVKEQEAEKRKHRDIVVRSPEKFPLDDFTWGYLPPSVELFFGEFNIDCQMSRTNTELKSNHTCIMRHGIRHSNNKSFISCISDIKYMYNHSGKLINEKPVLILKIY